MKKSKDTAQTVQSVIYIIIIVVIVGGLSYFGFRSQKPTENITTNNIPTTMNTLDNGLQYEVIQEGTGIEAKNGDIAVVNYTGTLQDGTVFDSNVLPEFKHVMPFEFTIGSGQVIKGWDIGVAGMKVGEKRKLVLPADLAYGPRAVGALIPANATLVFEVELTGIK